MKIIVLDSNLGGVLLFVLVSFILTAIAVIKKPGDTISYYGYKTPRSLKNNTTWKLANTFAVKCQMVSFVVFLITTICFLIFIPEQAFYATAITMTTCYLSVIPVTEIFLSLVFDKEGNQRIYTDDKK